METKNAIRHYKPVYFRLNLLILLLPLLSSSFDVVAVVVDFCAAKKATEFNKHVYSAGA